MFYNIRLILSAWQDETIKIINEPEPNSLVKYYASILSATIAAILILGFASQALASQMTGAVITDSNKTNASFTGVKNISIKYPEASSLAQQLNGKNDRIEFTLNGTSTDPNLAGLIQATNKALLAEKSPAQVTAANLHYIATIKGGPSSTLISVKVDYQPTLQNIVLSKGAASTNGSATNGEVVDLEWRAWVINGPIVVKSPAIGEININQAIGAIQAKYPDIASKLTSSGDAAVLQEPIMDFTKFNAPMSNWHFLFDPVGTYGSGVITGSEFQGAKALSVYSLGESSFREGTFESQETTASATIDGAAVNVKSQTPPPSAQITIAGYSKLQGQAGGEYAVVTPQAPEGVQTSSGGFPIQVLLVFGGMMGAIAVFILFKARK
ncbi:MAG TPA: hypothetical protein VE199_05460 [Nitrososphaera sp.]|nr:hypothetical protein [Nitrososphaera sp.]